MVIDRNGRNTCCHLTPNVQERQKHRSRNPQRVRQPRIQEMFMMKGFTLTELVELAAEFQERARESIQAWLVQL